MRNILTILIFLLFLTSPLSVQYTQNGFQFQREAQGKTTCDDDDEDCKEEDEEDEDEDEKEDQDDEDEDGDEDAKKEDDDKNVLENVIISPASPTACKTSVTVVGTVGGSVANKVTPSLAKSANYSKGLVVFGINILATAEVADEKLLHAANITAELIDNNEDGTPDNTCVTEKLYQLSAYVSMYNLQEGNSVEINSDPLDEIGADKYTSLGAYETLKNYADGESHDASIEEIFHLISQRGYSSIYPMVFEESNTSTSSLAKAMDVARGGEQRCAKEECNWTYNNTSCPIWSDLVDSGDAWYFYADPTADYATMMTEYIYWSVSTNLGMHDSSAGRKKAKTEWCPNTKKLLKAQDPAVFNLINDPKYAIPTVLPNADYSFYKFKTSDINTF
ncbi:MAG: hypothetical protein JKY07_08230 [SAR324 cluster bacterium]|jgi:hypothetical protein|nr:hypothetical protein [SAR324 cluster bacterium]